MEVYRAPWVIPVTTPAIRDGIVVIEGGTILGVGPAEDLLPQLSHAALREFPRHAILPGLVNAHTHLMLTCSTEGHPRGKGLFPWLESVGPRVANMTDSQQREGVKAGLELSYSSGTALVGEILSGLTSLEPYTQDSRVLCRVFLEILGLDPRRSRESLDQAKDMLKVSLPAHVRLGLSPHAPYSLPVELWSAVAAASHAADLPWSSHVGESPEERLYLTRGESMVDSFLERLGIPPELKAPWGASAVATLEERGLMDGLLVHGVDLTPEEMERLAVNDTPLCLCPGSNEWLGLPSPSVGELFSRGVFLCLGTDSLASNRDLSLWKEMRHVRRLAPRIPASEILKMATAHGAIALQFNQLAGSIHPGSGSRLVAVELDSGGMDNPVESMMHEPVEEAMSHLGIWASPLGDR